MIPVEFVNPFLVATRRICGQTIKVSVTSGKARLGAAGERHWKLFPISGVIRLGGAVEGLISLSFSEPVALALAGGLAQQLFEHFDDDARDALGEVTNLIVGSAKRDLPGGLVTISTPRITQTHLVEFPPQLPQIILPFEVAPGRFIMQLALARAVQPLAAAAG